MNITLASLNELWVALDLRFQGAYKYAEPVMPSLATQAPSSTREQKYGWIGKIPRARKWVGERTINNLAAREYAIVNDDYEDTIKVARNDIEDEQLGLYLPGIDMLGTQAKLWPDDLMYGLLKYGDSLTPQTLDIGTLVNPVGFDNLPFFSGSHPIDINTPSLGTQSNLFNSTTSGALPLTFQNYGTVVRPAMAAFLGEDNRPMNLIPDTIVLPPQLELTGYQIANATLIAAAVGANAATGSSQNMIPTLKGAVKPLLFPQLTDAGDTWYTICTSMPIRPLVFQLRKAPQFVPLDKPNDANVFFRKEYIYGVDMRGAAGYALWFLGTKAANH